MISRSTFRSLVLSVVLATFGLLSAGGVIAQSPTFSIDFQSSSALPFGGPFSPGDLLVPPGPAVSIPVGVFGLVPSAATGEVEIDAIAQGNDHPFKIFGGAWAPPQPYVIFSVDEFATGVAGGAPDVASEGATGAMEASADLFRNLALPVGPVCPPGVIGNFQTNDGSGMGLNEPNPFTLGVIPDPGDNLDAVELYPMTFPLYFSLDAEYPDPLEAAPANSGTAAANGFSGADILRAGGGGGFGIYAPAASLGLTKEDDVDALILSENGIPGFQPPAAPYDWQFLGTDLIFYSVRRGSPIIGTLDSFCGWPIEEGDLLMPAGPGAPPGIFIAAETLGLVTRRSFGGGIKNLGDDLDAATTRR